MINDTTQEYLHAAELIAEIREAQPVIRNILRTETIKHEAMPLDENAVIFNREELTGDLAVTDSLINWYVSPQPMNS